MKKLFAVLLLAMAPALSFAQVYPSKAVRIIVPFPAGGATDQVARVMQAKFSEFLGQPAVVDNKGGAGGSIGATEAARSAPDGYTLLMVTDTHAINHFLYKQAPDIFKSLEHMSLLITSPSMLHARTGFAPNNLKELVERARSEPRAVTYGSVGTGSSTHLAALLLEQRAGILMTHVPFKGGGPLVQAILGNQIDFAFISAPLILPHVKAGKAKAIAIGGKQRIAQMPDLPTLSETYPGMEMVTWYGILAPAGVPRDIFNRIYNEVVRTLAVPEVKDRLVATGLDVVASSPKDFLTWVQGESEKLGKVIKDFDIKVE